MDGPVILFVVLLFSSAVTSYRGRGGARYYTTADDSDGQCEKQIKIVVKASYPPVCLTDLT